MNWILIIVTVLSLIVPTKKALHMFQQNRYETSRYTMWIKDSFKHNSKAIINGLIITILALLCGIYVGPLATVIIIALYSLKVAEKEYKTVYIKPLVLTHRVMRQIAVMVLIYLAVIITCSIIGYHALMYLLILSPFIAYGLMYVMSAITFPIEYCFREMFKNSAKKILENNKRLVKVGITGSYGKTSSKNIVNEILSEQYYSLPTPASFNTPMGLTITIRENLKNTHEVFIAEMGADKVGDIVELSNLVHPEYAIITSIGPQHLSTFKSIENIINEKMSLVERLPENGVAVLNKDNEYIRNYVVKNNVKVVSYGIEYKDADYIAENIKYDMKGSSFDIVYQDERYAFSTRLLGEHNVLNILSGVALGRELNVSWENLQKAVRKINFIEHRLELKKINNRMFIDNAFNSNPEGAAMSLKVISMMANQRVVITPGMIDLGVIQNEENFKFGAQMINQVDTVLLVGKNQTKPIYDGLVSTNFNLDNVHVFDTVKEALAYAYAHTSEDDIILLENDLPDAFSN